MCEKLTSDLDNIRRRPRRKAFSLIEVVVASGLLAIGMVPILRGLTSAHFAATVIERKTKSLAFAKAEIDEIRARMIYNYDASYDKNNVSLGGSYLCRVDVDVINSDIKDVSVKVGFDTNGNGILVNQEVLVNLNTLVAKRW
ncbi:MAG: type II secretion system protein [Sedimentisphaerales bacterium]|nr:type II secretion system protein [Sedimentisphaerales bacterium]